MAPTYEVPQGRSPLARWQVSKCIFLRGDQLRGHVMDLHSMKYYHQREMLRESMRPLRELIGKLRALRSGPSVIHHIPV